MEENLEAIRNYNKPCGKCKCTWHQTKDHDSTKAKKGSIEEWEVFAGGRTVVYDGIVHQFYYDENDFQNNAPRHRSIPLSELKDYSEDEYIFDKLSPYHRKHINNPNYQWVNCCSMYVEKKRMIDGSCPYHQRVLSDGTLLYDEFNQDGE